MNKSYYKNVFLPLFLSSHERKSRFLYTNICREETLFFLGNTREKDFKYADPRQTAYIVNIKNESDLTITEEILDEITSLKERNTVSKIINLGSIAADLNKGSKIKRDDEENEEDEDNENDVNIADVKTFFFYSGLINKFASYTKGLFITNKSSYVDIGLDHLPKVNQVFRLSKETLENLNPDLKNKKVLTDKKFILMNNVELIKWKSLFNINQCGSYRLRFWFPDETASCLCVASIFDCPNFTVMSGRLNLMIYN